MCNYFEKQRSEYNEDFTIERRKQFYKNEKEIFFKFEFYT